MRSPKDVGEISELKFIIEFRKRNMPVYIPYGDNNPADMVIEIRDKFYKIQVKTAHKYGSGFRFNSIRFGRDYVGEADFFGVYYPENNRCYLIPIDDTAIKPFTLSLDPMRKNRNTDLAINYELDFSLGITLINVIYDIDQ